MSPLELANIILDLLEAGADEQHEGLHDCMEELLDLVTEKDAMDLIAKQRVFRENRN